MVELFALNMQMGAFVLFINIAKWKLTLKKMMTWGLKGHMTSASLWKALGMVILKW
jgi:hypothetical protein